MWSFRNVCERKVPTVDQERSLRIMPHNEINENPDSDAVAEVYDSQRVYQGKSGYMFRCTHN